MKKFYVSDNPDETGMHQIHDEDCIHLPPIFYRKYLGRFDISFEAMETARRYFKRVKGCQHCTSECLVY